jgi:hypothetical protein
MSSRHPKPSKHKHKHKRQPKPDLSRTCCFGLGRRQSAGKAARHHVTESRGCAFEKALRTIAASRWPWRLPSVASMSRSTPDAVRYSRVRKSGGVAARSGSKGMAVASAISRIASATIARNSKNLVQPHLVAIYSEREVTGGIVQPDQSGTGFIISWRDRSTLVTGKHSLYGPNGHEDPRAKSVFVNGALTRIADLKSQIITDPNHDLAALHIDDFDLSKCDPNHDLAALHIDDFDLSKCLPSSVIHAGVSQTKLVTIHGFLSRRL